MSIELAPDNKKQIWTRPALIILGKSKPEENVLHGCKVKSGAGPEGSGCVGKKGHGTCHGKTNS